jgi:anti-sigma regulatory factor (Ser/Thr protein kinase)
MPRPFPHVAADRPARYMRRGLSPALGLAHSLVIDGAPEQVSVARAFVRQVLGNGHPGADRVALLTSELVTNSVNHSNSRLAGGTIAVTLRVAADRIRVEVADDGGNTTPALRRDGDLAEAGRGLWLVDAYSLAWDCRHSATRTVTWFECVPEPLP